LLAPKKGTTNQDILEVFKQVKINIHLLDAIKQISSYAKFLKDLCTVKRKLSVKTKAFFTEHVSAIIQLKIPLKHKDPGSLTIQCIIGDSKIDKTLFDLGAGVNLLPYSVYEKLGFGELKPTKVVLQLADQYVVILRGIVEDVLVQIDRFYFPVDFIVLDTQPIAQSSTNIHVILGRPFLATSNALINCRNGIMKLTFRNMTVELNIFNICKQPVIDDENEIYEVDMIQNLVEDKFAHSMFSVLIETCLLNPNSNNIELDIANAVLDANPMMDTKGWNPCFENLYIPIKIHPSSIKAQKIENPKNGNFFKEKYLKPFFEDFELIDESFDLADPVYQDLPNT
jgi:hypothetical protein